MITISKFKERIQGKFEGGNSMNLNWFNIAKEAGQAMMANLSPKRLTRNAPLYGGVVGGITVYYCPEDMGAPKGIYKQLVKLDYDYVPSSVFDDQVRDFPYKKIFTKAYLNGATFIYINNGEEASGSLLVDNMSNPASITISDMVLTLNTYDYLTGSASLMGLFTPTLNKVNGTILGGKLDLTDSLFGTAILNISTMDYRNIESIVVKLKTNDLNYFSLTATTAMSYLANGYNFVRMSLADRVATGTPVITDINSYEIRITTKVGTSQTIILDGLSIYKTAPYTLSFVSNNMFVDKNTYVRKATPTDLEDVIEIEEEEEEDILIYEACRIVVQEGTNDNVNSNESTRFDKELSRKYSLYFGKNPSDKKPLSYNYSTTNEELM